MSLQRSLSDASPWPEDNFRSVFVEWLIMELFIFDLIYIVMYSTFIFIA